MSLKAFSNFHDSMFLRFNISEFRFIYVTLPAFLLTTVEVQKPILYLNMNLKMSWTATHPKKLKLCSPQLLWNFKSSQEENTAEKLGSKITWKSNFVLKKILAINPSLETWGTNLCLLLKPHIHAPYAAVFINMFAVLRWLKSSFKHGTSTCKAKTELELAQPFLLCLSMQNLKAGFLCLNVDISFWISMPKLISPSILNTFLYDPRERERINCREQLISA